MTDFRRPVYGLQKIDLAANLESLLPTSYTDADQLHRSEVCLIRRRIDGNLDFRSSFFRYFWKNVFLNEVVRYLVKFLKVSFNAFRSQSPDLKLVVAFECVEISCYQRR